MQLPWPLQPLQGVSSATKLSDQQLGKQARGVLGGEEACIAPSCNLLLDHHASGITASWQKPDLDTVTIAVTDTAGGVSGMLHFTSDMPQSARCRRPWRYNKPSLVAPEAFSKAPSGDMSEVQCNTLD